MSTFITKFLAVLTVLSTPAFAGPPIIWNGSSARILPSGGLSTPALSVDGLAGVLKASGGVVAGSSTTSDLTEGSNLYFTNARAQSAISGSITGKAFYVAKDTGNDSNAGGIFSPFRTIQAGINACNAIAAYYAQCTVHVAPSQGGTGSGYVENLSFSQQGVNLLCDAQQIQTRACLVTGTVTVNLTGTSGGANFVAALNEVYMTGFVVSQTSTNNTLVFSGSTFQRFISNNNYFDQNGSASNTVISNTGTTGGTPSALISYYTDFNNSNATNPTISLTSGARFWMNGSQTAGTISNGNASGPSFTQSGAASSVILNLVQLTGQYNLTDNTSTATFNLSTINSGTNPCIVTPSSPNTGYALLAYYGCTSSNTNSITGTGVVVGAPGNIRTSTSGDIISTVTQIVFPGLPQGEIMIGAGATTGTNVALSLKDGHIKVAQTTAPTTTLSGNAGTGGTPACTITNGTDSDGKISLKTGTASWATGTQCTINFNKTWGVAPICIFSPSNDAASTAMASQRIVFPDAATTTQTISAGVAFASQVTATWHYHCGESQ